MHIACKANHHRDLTTCRSIRDSSRYRYQQLYRLPADLPTCSTYSHSDVAVISRGPDPIFRFLFPYLAPAMHLASSSPLV